MCDPMTAMAATSMAISVGSTIAAAEAKNEKAEQTRENAREAHRQRIEDLGFAQEGVQERASRSIMEVESKVRRNMALESLSQGEAGVTGISAQAVMRDLEGEAAETTTDIREDREAKIDQFQRSKQTATTIKENRVEAARGANPYLTGLQIAGAGVRAGVKMARSDPLGTDGGAPGGGEGLLIPDDTTTPTETV